MWLWHQLVFANLVLIIYPFNSDMEEIFNLPSLRPHLTHQPVIDE